MASRIFLFSIVLGAEYSFYVKSITTYNPTFFGNNNSVLAIVPTALTPTLWGNSHPKLLTSFMNGPHILRVLMALAKLSAFLC